MTIVLHTEDPGVEGVWKAVKRYKKQYSDLADALEMYETLKNEEQ